MPHVPAYNETHEHIGSEIYTVLLGSNDIHGAIALYSVSKFSTCEFCPTHYENIGGL